MFFRLENEAPAAVAEAPALPRVDVRMVHNEWFIVMLVGENGAVEDVRREDNMRAAVELAQNLVMLGVAEWNGKIEEVRALVA